MEQWPFTALSHFRTIDYLHKATNFAVSLEVKKELCYNNPCCCAAWQLCRVAGTPDAGAACSLHDSPAAVFYFSYRRGSATFFSNS